MMNSYPVLHVNSKAVEGVEIVQLCLDKTENNGHMSDTVQQKR